MVDEGSDRAPDLLLDTNIVIVVLSQEDAALARFQEAAGSFFVSVITLGELRFGARKSGMVEENLQKVEDFAAESNILPCDEGTSRHYGEVKDGLRRKGRPIPENDIWISATALQYGLVLVTRDSHFEYVEGLCRASGNPLLRGGSCTITVSVVPLAFTRTRYFTRASIAMKRETVSDFGDRRKAHYDPRTRDTLPGHVSDNTAFTFSTRRPNPPGGCSALRGAR